MSIDYKSLNTQTVNMQFYYRSALECRIPFVWS